MKKPGNLITCILTTVFVLSAYPAWSAGNRIGFINLEKAVAGTREWKREFSAFKAMFQKEKKLIAAKEKQIQGMFEELKKQGFVLEPKLKAEKEEKFRNEKKDFERYVQDKNEEFSRTEKEITQKLLKKMVKVLRKLGKEKKLTMIVDQKAVIYYAPENDLTDLAIKAFDRTGK